ncbi:MAG: 16S rRNA (guanine(966)-N(2))-methyltransferase RsmD [Usitatibacteraceae bacterium]
MPQHFKPSARGKPQPGKAVARAGQAKHNRVRIIGGTWRSRVIEFPDVEGLRPTANRVRETLFNWLGQTLHDKRCLDLFAGSGALGFEAASRGASESVMLEVNAAAIAALKANQQKLDASTCRIVPMDALKFIESGREKFDIIFIDPPFTSGLMATLLARLQKNLLDGGLLYAEWGAPIADVLAEIANPQWEIVKQGRAGAVHCALLRCPDAIV